MNKVMLISLAILGFALSSLGDKIPVGDQLDWTHAGLYSAYPTVADTVFQINLMPGQGTNQKVLNAISGAQSYTENHPTRWAIIYLPKGENNDSYLNHLFFLTIADNCQRQDSQVCRTRHKPVDISQSGVQKPNRAFGWFGD